MGAWRRGLGLSLAFASLSRLWAVQIHRPFASDLVETSEQELSKAYGAFDLTENGFDDLLAQPVAAASSAPCPCLPQAAAVIRAHQPSSPRKRGFSIPEASNLIRDAAAYWVARSSRAMTVEFEARAHHPVTLPAAA